VRLYGYISQRALLALVAALVGIVAMFLAIDFADNPVSLDAPGALAAVAELYLNKAAIIGYQTAPAALILAAGLTVNGLRGTNEYTALRALGFGPWRLAVPVLALALAAGAALFAAHATLVVPAAARAERIAVQRLGQAVGAPARPRALWFRSRDGRRIYHLRGHLDGGGFERVTIFELTPGFRVARRTDGEHMVPTVGGGWTIDRVTERTFEGRGEGSYREYPTKTFRFEETAGAFDVLTRRPADMSIGELRSQSALRRDLGLAAGDLELELYNRLAHPFSAVATVAVAIALALRQARRAQLSVTLIEAVACSVTFWAAQGLFWALARNGRIPAPAAAWGPDVLFLAAGVVLVARSR
jgi:lipopolysaccharide export system permease protein